MALGVAVHIVIAFYHYHPRLSVCLLAVRCALWSTWSDLNSVTALLTAPRIWC